MKTFELVLIGHPDKVCDGIAEEIRKANPNGRNAIEVCWFNNLIIIGGETNKTWNIDELGEIVFNYLINIVGLTDDEMQGIMVESRLQEQSSQINDAIGHEGCGDNGIFFGGWHRVYSPVIFEMKKMVKELTYERLCEWGYRTDGKILFTVDATGYVNNIVINIASYKGGDKSNENALSNFIGSYIKGGYIDVNPRGDWYKCFGFADAGLTNRKIVCDTSCGLFRIGGGGMMGKDLSKPDRAINIYLTQWAKELSIENDEEYIELEASCVIGDSYVNITCDNLSLETILDYKDIVSDTLEIDIFGGFENE